MSICRGCAHVVVGARTLCTLWWVRARCGVAVIQLSDVVLEAGRRTLLNRVSLHIPKGRKVVLVGPSGSGKTSLLRLVLGMLRPVEGDVIVAGHALSPANALIIRQVTAYVPQVITALPDETAEQFVWFPLTFRANRNRGLDAAELPDLVQRFGLEPTVLERAMDTLSGGERQRLAIIRALLLRRSVLVLDEVTSAVDESARNAVLDHLFSLEATILAVAHDPEWERRADIVARLEDGALCFPAGGDR